jgi:hypothetical protein
VVRTAGRVSSAASASTVSQPTSTTQSKKRSAASVHNDDANDDEPDDGDDADDATTAAALPEREPGAPEKVGDWTIGSVCQAIWSGDGAWYDAVVKRITAQSELVVEFEGYGDEETLPPEKLKVPDHAAAAKRKKAQAEDPYAEMPIPASLKIMPSDSEEVRERKRKRVRAIKSKNRLRRMEREKNQAANSWKSFLNKKASAKAVTGFASATKKTKTSIFRSPDTVDGKVGVTNSGKQLSSYQDRKEGAEVVCATARSAALKRLFSFVKAENQAV